MRTRIPGVLYEAVAEPMADGGGGEPADPVEAPAGEPAEPDATPDYEPEHETAAPFDFDAAIRTPEGREALRQAMYEEGFAQPGGYEDPYAQQYEPEPDPIAGFDFLADDAPQQLAMILEQRDQRLLEAIQGSPALVAAEEQHNQTWATNAFAGIEKQLGAELPEGVRDMAITMAAGSRPPDGHPGLGHFDPGRALHESAQSLHALIQRERADAVRAYQAGVTGGGTGGAEPPAGGTGAIHSEPVPSNMREAREAWERRQGLRD